MKTLFAVLNIMLFCVVLAMASVKFGYAKEFLKSTVKEVVQEELSERFKDKLPQIQKPDTKSWWRENGKQ